MAILTVLSLVVALVTVWNLRMTGITIANSACCGLEEHQHIEECFQEELLICETEEHIHTTACYSDPGADVETSVEWRNSFCAYPFTGDLRKDLVGIAKTQVGYTESQLNFELTESGERRGYTRYGAWYGAPYKKWSAMFVSFCLNYAGADQEEFPNSSGANSMAELWKAQQKYAAVGEYSPRSGDLVFFNNNTVGIVAEVLDFTFCVIRGDQQNAVTSDIIPLNDHSITGWGITELKKDLIPAPTEEPVAEEPVPEEPVQEEPVPEEPVAEELVAEEPVAEEPVAEEPVAEEPVQEEPVAEELLPEEPVAEEPVQEEPVAEELLPEEPVPEEPVAEEPVVEEPVPEEPVPEEPVAEELLPEEPVQEEPVAEEPVAEEPVQEEPVAEEPMPEEPVPEELLQEELLPEELLQEELLPEEPLPEELMPEEIITQEDILDISNGPAFYIFEGNATVAPMMKTRSFSLRSTNTTAELLTYLNGNGGSYFFTLLDKNNIPLPKDEQGNFIAQANTGYKLTVSFTSPKGFLPGTYRYQVPNGLMVDGGNGEFILTDGTKVGEWVVTDTGEITLIFNEEMNSRSDITISATMGINFPEQDEPIDFDGLIRVKVEPPVQQANPTAVSKWGTPNAEAGKLNWNVLIKGNADSQIPGSILTDQVTLPDWGKPHSYTETDMAAGINFGVTAADGSWHTWTVTTDDPHLIWDENSWSYKIPQTVTCKYCGELELGNAGWEYMVTYTSTPTPLNTPGSFAYENKVTVDGQSAWGWNEFVHGSIDAQIEKNGSFSSDAAGGGFLWEVQVTIPGRPEGQRAEYAWFFMDEMKLFDEKATAIGKVHNDINLATVMTTYNGTTIEIPKIQDATDQDMFAWDNQWSSEGIASTRTINLLCRCQCTPETCHWGNCEDYWFKYEDGTSDTKGFCQCWTENQNMTFIFVYRTTDISVIENYGSLGYKLNNLAQLYYMVDGNNSVQVDYDDASIGIPNLFEKQLTHDFNGYTARYKITVNESKVPLTNGSPLTIHDEMTDTLAYISGSLVITTENVNGHTSMLQQGIDFTVEYDGTGNQTDENGKKVHVLDIVILNPQPVMYILNYDTTLIMPEQITGGLKYGNSANITLWGDDLQDSAVEKVYADINIAAKNHSVEMFKTCAVTNKPLPGATFGLFNAQGGLVTKGVTNANGRLLFETNVTEGIILQDHVAYYLQEIQAPPAYRLDDTKFWFCFCNNNEAFCINCETVMVDVKAERIPLDEIGMVDIANYPSNVQLPATGGIGTPIYILCGLTLLLGSLVYGFGLRRRYERRSDP